MTLYSVFMGTGVDASIARLDSLYLLHRFMGPVELMSAIFHTGTDGHMNRSMPCIKIHSRFHCSTLQSE